jgi:hypothetical protein
MSRVFVGRGYSEPTRYKVYTEQDGMRSDMTRQVGGSSVDYQWDGAGPNSAELARALLWLVQGVEPDWRLSRLFASEIISAWPRHAGECWRISEDEINAWLAQVEQDTSRTESTPQTKARLGEALGRESRLRSFAATFAGRQF